MVICIITEIFLILNATKKWRIFLIHERLQVCIIFQLALTQTGYDTIDSSSKATKSVYNYFNMMKNNNYSNSSVSNSVSAKIFTLIINKCISTFVYISISIQSDKNYLKQVQTSIKLQTNFEIFIVV